MSVLSRQSILKRLSEDPTKPDALVVTPDIHLREEMLDIDAIDLRLGCHFLLPRLSLSRRTHFCPDSKSSKALHIHVHVPLGRYIVVPAHQTVLGSTLEFIKLPTDVSGEILTKSSIARTFTLIETAPWIHPGYRGCLTLEIANVSNTPLLLYPGRAIGQLVLMSVDADDERNHERALGGKYVGPVYPEAPVFDDPAEELKAIGVNNVWQIEDPKPPKA